jgi:hypothetical protein
MGPEQAAGEIKRLVNRVQQAKGWTFDQAWTHVNRTEPLLNGIFHLPAGERRGFLMNRVPGQSEEDLWKIVRATQDTVRERLFREFDTHNYRTVIVRGGANSLNGLAEALRQIMADQTNGDFDHAWEFMQRSHPAAFANFILASPEAAAAQGLDNAGEESERVTWGG